MAGTALAVLLGLVRYGYGWVMAVRGWLYGIGVFSSEVFDIPVIVLGNLRIGGTGKSPHAAYVVQTLLDADFRVALLSRGYGRQTTGFRTVTATDAATTVGDEPLEQARRFQVEIERGVLTVAVAENRALGIRTLLVGPHPPDVVVLDDAYQHRAVRPSLLVLLTEFHRPFSADRILPLGRLREFGRAARRAHAVVVTKSPPAEPRPELVRGFNVRAVRRAAGENTPVFFTSYTYAPWQPLTADTPPASRPPTPPGPPLLLLTAIDNPAPLLDHLLGRGFTIAKHLRFSDHHAFTAAELLAVRTAALGADATIVTTGKDAVRLLTPAGAVRPELAGVSVWWVPVVVHEVPPLEKTAPATLRALVLDHVRDFAMNAPNRPRKAGLVALLLAVLRLAGAPLHATAQVAPQTPPVVTPATQTPADPAATGTPGASEKPKKTRRILNDSAQTRYSARTTNVYFEADVLRGDDREHPLDTTFHEFWNPRRWYRDTTTFQQDLGNVGTGARRQLWPVGQPQAGIRWGRNAFDRYVFDPAAIPYYDTRSPFSSLHYVQGARGEQAFEGRYTRNIKRVFNFGGAYQRLSANKQFATTQPKDNFLTHSASSVWAAYATPDSTWRVLANYAHLRHEVIEQGPVLAQPDTTDLYANVPVALAFARNCEFRNTWRLTQVLRLVGPGLQVFYTFERRVQRNRFSDTRLQNQVAPPLRELDFFPQTLLDTNRTQDDARFRLNQHTAGVLGAARFGAYRLYASRRDAAYRLYQPGTPVRVPDAAVQDVRRLGRLAFGGEASFRVRDLVAVTADGELQTGDNTYWLRATGRFRTFSFSQLRNGYSPEITQNVLYGNHFQWNNAFANTQRDESRVQVAGRFGQQRLSVDAAFTRVRNLVYYGSDSTPQQEGTTLTLGTVQGRWRGQFGPFFTDVRAAVTTRPGRSAEVIRTPPLLADVLVYYQGYLLKKALFGQIGLQAYAQADVRAYAWQPATQQFHVQNKTLVRTYPQVDAFFAADLKNVNIFIRVAHVGQGLLPGDFYLTPGYPQLRRSLTFGVKWLFFD